MSFCKRFRCNNNVTRTPLIHPHMFYTSIQTFDTACSKFINEKTFRKLTRHVGSDLALSVFFAGSARYVLLPFNIFLSNFMACNPPSKNRHKHSVWQKIALQTLGIDMRKGLVSPHLQLGMWPALQQKDHVSAERMLGIIRRHGSMRNYMYRLQKTNILSKQKK